MAPKEKTVETVQQAHVRIRAAAITHFSHRPHMANDRLEWIKERMCEFRGIPYVPPMPPPLPIAVPAPEDGSLPLGVLTEAPDKDEDL